MSTEARRERRGFPGGASHGSPRAWNEGPAPRRALQAERPLSDLVSCRCLSTHRCRPQGSPLDSPGSWPPSGCRLCRLLGAEHPAPFVHSPRGRLPVATWASTQAVSSETSSPARPGFSHPLLHHFIVCTSLWTDLALSSA